MSNGEESAVAEEAPAEQSGETPEQLAITPGATVPSTTTIDAVFTSVFSTRSADLAATPVYTWAVAPSTPTLVATWAAANNPSVMMVARFECRNAYGPGAPGGPTSSVGP